MGDNVFLGGWQIGGKLFIFLDALLPWAASSPLCWAAGRTKRPKMGRSKFRGTPVTEADGLCRCPWLGVDFEYSHLTMGELNWAGTSVHCMFVQFLPLTNVWIWQGLEFQGNPYQPTISLILKLFTFSFQKLSPCAHYTRFRLQLLPLWKAHLPFPGAKVWFFSLPFFAPLDNNINIIAILTSKELQLWQWRVKWNWGEVAKVNSCAADGNQWVTNTKLGYPRTKKNTKQSNFKRWRTNISYNGEHEQP